MLKLTIFQGSPCWDDMTTSNTSPVRAKIAPIRWLMLLNLSPSCMANGLVNLFFHWLMVSDFQLKSGLFLETGEMAGASFQSRPLYHIVVVCQAGDVLPE